MGFKEFEKQPNFGQLLHPMLDEEMLEAEIVRLLRRGGGKSLYRLDQLSAMEPPEGAEDYVRKVYDRFAERARPGKRA